jgi:regulatory protein
MTGPAGSAPAGGAPAGGGPVEDEAARGGANRGEAVRGGADPEARARQVCYRLLTLAPRTRGQLAEALAKRGIPDDVAEGVLAKFSSAGLIDDAAFAKSWVESRHSGRGLGSRALSAELRNRGIASDDIRDALDDLDPAEEAATARRLVERKLAATQGLAPEARTRRLAGMLARKGYPAGLAFRVVREAMEAEGLDVVIDDALPD